MAVNAKSMLDGNESGSTAQSVGHEGNGSAIVTQICKIFKDYNLYITGSLILPDGNRYDRIFNVGVVIAISMPSVRDWNSLEYQSITYI